MKNICVPTILAALGPGRGFAQTTADLVHDGKNQEHVTAQSMGYDRKNYSPLAQINRSNVKHLVHVRHRRRNGPADLAHARGD